MRCSKARKLISEYIDRTLDPRKSLFLEQHLEACSKCQELLQDFEGIVGAAKKLEPPSPSHDVWKKIAARLSAAKQDTLSPQPQKRQERLWLHVFGRSFQFRYALSAALVLAVISAGVIFGLRQWKEKGLESRSDLEKYTIAKLEEAQTHYRQAIKALNEAISAQGGTLDPGLAEVFQRNLEVIDSSIEACQKAVSREPDNLEARIYLLAVYREKVTFLDGMYEAKKSFLKKGFEKTL